MAGVLAVAPHPDDDLLFFNPDVDDDIAAGVTLRTLYVTAGDAGLAGTAANDRARSRQRGIQEAYRLMTGVTDLPGQGEWTGQVITIAGRRLEEYRLTDRPNVRVVFMGLPDGGVTDVLNNVSRNTVPATGGLVTTPQSYDRETAISVMQGLLTRYQPATVRHTEEFADARYDALSSHPDHRAATGLLREAIDRYRDAASTWLPVEIEYRDYGNGLFPADLDPDAHDRKTLIFTTYQAFDPVAANLYEWTARTYYRRAPGTQWSAVDGAGTVHLFVVRGGSVVSWRLAGTTVSGPFDLGGDVRIVTATTRPNGQVHLAARTLDERIVTRPAVGGSWTDLDTPNPGDDAKSVGTPVLAPNADGRLQLFVVNAGGGLSTRWQVPGGGWSGWADFGGSDLQDPCSALLNRDGRIEVVATTREGLHIYFQTSPNNGWGDGDLPSAEPASAASLTMNADGRLEVHYRQADTAEVATTWQDEDGAWRNFDTLGGEGGFGQPATAVVSGLIATATRNAGGGVSLAMQTEQNNGYSDWIDLGGYIDHYPTLAATPDGRLVLAAVHSDGTLRQRTRSAAGTWSGWRLLAAV